MNPDRERKIAFNYGKIESNPENFPPSLQVSLTDACFNKCMMCDHHLMANKKVMDLKDWINFLHLAKGFGVETVCYSGGDSLAYPHLNEVMEKHVELGIDFGFITTGYVPPNIDMELLSMARWVRCSLDAIDPEIYKRIRGGVSVEKVLTSISLMKNEGVDVGISATVHNENADDIFEVMRYAQTMNINDVWIKCVYPGTAPDDLVNWEKIENFRHAFSYFRTSDGNYEEFEHCHASRFQLYIDANGDIYPCCIMAGDTDGIQHMNPLGHINDSLFLGEITKNFSMLNSLSRPEACSKCQGRFTEINHVCDNIVKQRTFF